MVNLPTTSSIEAAETLFKGPALNVAQWEASVKEVRPSAEFVLGATNKAAKEAKGIINGFVLDVAQWAASVNTVHPSTHRLLNATFLCAGLFGGRTIMNLLVGETPGGDKIDREDIPYALRPLHGALAYNHFSDKASDRWMKVMDMWFPAAIGAVGAMSGSHVFALDQKLVQESKAFIRAPEKLTLETAEAASIVAQSEPWRALSGITSLFGSAAGFQLIPGPANYGTTLSNSFLGTVARNKLHTPYAKWLQEFINSNKHPFPYGPTSMLSKFREYLVHNPEKDLKQAQKMGYAILEPWFGEHATPERVEAFVKEVETIRSKFLKDGGVPDALKADCQKQLTEVMHGLGLEKTLEKIGLDPAEATVGRNGMVEYMSRVLGYEKTLNRISEGYKTSYLKRNGRLAAEAVPPAPHSDSNAAFAIGASLMGAAGLAAGAGAINAQKWHKQDNDTLLRRAIGKTKPETKEAAEFNEDQKELDERKKEVDKLPFAERVANEKRDNGSLKQSGIAKTFNDKPLALLEWGADALNSPETHGMHRVFCAGGLSLGGLIGMKFMDVLVGRTLTGQVLDPSKVPDFMMGLYKKLAYNPHSDHPKDRWGYVAHFMVPAVAATVGVVGASSYFFKDTSKRANKAEYLDEYEMKATMDESGPWTGLTALTSLFVTPSGFPYLPPPAPNYGTALGTRFNLSSGRKVILPVIGDLWTATASRYPYGPSRLRDMMIKYAVNSPDAHPEQLEEMAIGILKPWFESVSKEQIENFIDAVERDRNKFLQCGGIPEEMKRQAEQELTKHFKGAGLEETLREIGIDPSTAHLGNNGLSGKIAEYLGAGDALKKTNREYKEKYAEHLEQANEEKKHQRLHDNEHKAASAAPSTELKDATIVMGKEAAASLAPADTELDHTHVKPAEKPIESHSERIHHKRNHKSEHGQPLSTGA